MKIGLTLIFVVCNASAVFAANTRLNPTTSTLEYLKSHPALWDEVQPISEMGKAYYDAGDSKAALPYQQAAMRMYDRIPIEGGSNSMQISSLIFQYKVQASNYLFEETLAAWPSVNNLLRDTIAAESATSEQIIELLEANILAARCFEKNERKDLCGLVLNDNLSLSDQIHNPNQSETIKMERILSDTNMRIAVLERPKFASDLKSNVVFHYAIAAIDNYNKMLDNDQFTLFDGRGYEKCLKAVTDVWQDAGETTRALAFMDKHIAELSSSGKSEQFGSNWSVLLTDQGKLHMAYGQLTDSINILRHALSLAETRTGKDNGKYAVPTILEYLSGAYALTGNIDELKKCNSRLSTIWLGRLA